MLGMPHDLEAERRHAARQNWPGLKTTLEQAKEADDLRATTTMEERLGMMWRLTLNAWAMSSQVLPTYTRMQMPGRVIRPAARP